MSIRSGVSVQITRANCRKFVEDLNRAKFARRTTYVSMQISCNNFVYKLVRDGKLCLTATSYGEYDAAL